MESIVPDVDEIANLSTAIVIDQKRMGRTLREGAVTHPDFKVGGWSTRGTR
jgi:excinuclease UvrABC ATPase subunit